MNKRCEISSALAGVEGNSGISRAADSATGNLVGKNALCVHKHDTCVKTETRHLFKKYSLLDKTYIEPSKSKSLLKIQK